MTTKLDELFDRIQNLPIPNNYEAGNMLEFGNILAQLIEEVKRIDSATHRANNIASCLANGIQPD